MILTWHAIKVCFPKFWYLIFKLIFFCMEDHPFYSNAYNSIKKCLNGNLLYEIVLIFKILTLELGLFFPVKCLCVLRYTHSLERDVCRLHSRQDSKCGTLHNVKSHVFNHTVKWGEGKKIQHYFFFSYRNFRSLENEKGQKKNEAILALSLFGR